MGRDTFQLDIVQEQEDFDKTRRPTFGSVVRTQVKSVMVRLGPYDNSDYYEIIYLPDTHEIVVKFNDEGVHSCMIEEP